MIDLTEVMNAINGCSGKIYSQMRKVSRGFTEALRNPWAPKTDAPRFKSQFYYRHSRGLASSKFLNLSS